MIVVQPAQPARPAVPAARDRTDGSSFQAFYSVRYGHLAAQIYAYLADRAEAEDVAQEAFLRAWQRWETVRRYDDPVAWVRRVAWNLATSRWRRVVTAARAMRRHLPEVVPALGPDHVALVAALRQLPDRHRLAIVLHYLADLPVKEVSEELGVPVGTVVSWLYRGRARLAALLTEPGAGGQVGRHG